MGCFGRCGIYKDRPQFCRDYPRVTDFIPPGCTFHFVGSERRGSCQPEVCGQNICCAWPREGGEPEGTALDPFAGGEPCKHLVWAETEPEKVASADINPPCVDQEAAQLVSQFLEEL
jgi:hypothetical protein